jgi:hypothetical protein
MTYHSFESGFILTRRMEGNIVMSSNLVDLELPHGVADCEGLLRYCWNSKFVLLTDDDGESIAIGV